MEALVLLAVLLAAPCFVQLVLWTIYRAITTVADLARVIQPPASSA